MSQTPYPLSNATDLEGYPTNVGQSVTESIDTILATFWNPLGALPNHNFQWLGNWGGTTSYKINGVAIFCTTGAEPDQIRIYDAPTRGTLLYQNNAPTWVAVPGTSGAYTYIQCYFSPVVLTQVHCQLKRNNTGAFNLNEVVPFYGTQTPYSGFPILLKRSFTGRSSYKAPGRRKPKYSSYPDSIHPSSPLAPNEVV